MSKKNVQVLQENNLQYKISQEKRYVKCSIYAHGVYFTGTAKCDDRDEFDAQFGKRLAYLRAIRKMKQGLIKATQMFLEEIQALPSVEEINDKVKYLTAGVEHLDAKIDELLATKR